MQLSEARTLAHALLAEHGLADWRLVFDNAKTRAGVCRPARREIGLSRVLTPLHTDAEVRDTILHEIAHALVGAEHGHDAVWRARAAAIGCTATRCVSPTAASAPAPWTGTCPAGHVTTRHRRPTRVVACGHCARVFDPRNLLDWTWHGQVVPMHPRYAAELARLTRTAASSMPTAAGSGAGAAAAATAPETRHQPAPAEARLPVGATVRIAGGGRYGGLVGTIEKRGRTRYRVRTSLGLLTVPFGLATPT